jgi:flagellum-specific peptidoglycan hydrolase FlgJ
MRKYILIAILVVLILILTTTKVGKELSTKVMETIKDYYKNLSDMQIARATQLIASLRKQGVPEQALPLVMAQIALESAHFNSLLSRTSNNFGGIKYFSQAGATPSSVKAPASEETKDGKPYARPYANFDSIDSFVKEYLRILNKVGNARPLQATTPAQYAHALKLNKYYQAPEADYARNIDSLSRLYTPFVKLTK